jgi:hypothetical protein
VQDNTVSRVIHTYVAHELRVERACAIQEGWNNCHEVQSVFFFLSFQPNKKVNSFS